MWNMAIHRVSRHICGIATTTCCNLEPFCLGVPAASTIPTGQGRKVGSLDACGRGRAFLDFPKTAFTRSRATFY